ncbi:DUF1330 domain-containing protein [Ferrovibrio sp.]|uniref:DUF1330 domain-containing protein n=1 Tax=Ferrovibrio sp. TaxID=1917215 RepID=UPI002619A938|nr:DUF1330 domain-containing protein [Ferrovibrio sp.]
MSAIVVSRIKVRDPEQMKAYGAAAASTVAAHGGEVLVRGNFAEALLGTGAPHLTGVMRFADPAAASAWFASPEYQALTSLREAAGDMEFFVYEAF